MDLSDFFKSIVEQDRCSVVICNLEHTIIYMNKAAIRRYSKRGGADLLGRSLLDCHNDNSNTRIRAVVQWFKDDINNNIVYTSYNAKENKDVYMVALRSDNNELIGYYEKHEYRNRESELQFYQMK